LGAFEYDGQILSPPDSLPVGFEYAQILSPLFIAVACSSQSRIFSIFSFCSEDCVAIEKWWKPHTEGALSAWFVLYFFEMM
jgi:hypothetical protein